MKSKSDDEPALERKVVEIRRRVDESLAQQRATADILRALPAAPGDAGGTLRKIAETTARLFGAAVTGFLIAEGDEFTLAIGVGHGAQPGRRSALRSREVATAG